MSSWFHYLGLSNPYVPQPLVSQTRVHYYYLFIKISNFALGWTYYFGFAPVFIGSVESLFFHFFGFIFDICEESASSYRNLGDEI